MLKYVLAFFIFMVPWSAMAGSQGEITKIKDGSEVRCMSGLATEEFIESGYPGKYYLGSGDCVTIENDLARNGELILHAECLGLRCPLYRFSKYIYIYREVQDDEESVLGTVTFLSDGSAVNQLILQHDSRIAYFPMKR